MSRESAEQKGRRLLVEGRLVVERVDERKIIASCRGDSGDVYRLGFDPPRSPPPARTCTHSGS